MARKATTRSQVQAKKKAAAKKAAPKKPVRGQRAATSAANQKKKVTKKAPAKKATAKKPNRMVVKPKKNSTRTPKVVVKPLQGKDLGGAKQAKVQQAKATPKTPLRGKDLGGAKQAKMQQAKSASSVKPAATAAARQTQVAKLLKQGMKRAGILGLGFAAADFAGLTPKLTDRDARMGRRTQEVQKKAANKKDKGLKKEVVKPKKKPVNRNAMLAAERKKEREEALAERLAARRAERKKKKVQDAVRKAGAAAKPKTPKNVLRDSSGNPVKSGSGSNIKTTDWDNITQEEIDRLYNF